VSWAKILVRPDQREDAVTLLNQLLQFLVVNFATSLSFLSACGFTLLATYPLYVHMRRGWAIKKGDIFNCFPPDAKVLYLKTYFQETFSVPQAENRFEALYQDRYGKYKYAFPIVLFVVTTLVAMFFLSEAAVTWINLTIGHRMIAIGKLADGWPLLVIPPIAAAGISGAYVWIVSDLITRARRLDLAPADILNSTLRLAISAALAVPMSQNLWGVLSLPIAFGLGAFPLDAVRVLLRRFVSDKFGSNNSQDDKPTDGILKLDAVDRSIADKLMDAEISTIAQLAHTDPVQLCIRTGLDFDFVLDIVSQSLASIYLGDRLNRLRACGLRGALEIYYLLVGLSDTSKPRNYALALAILEVAPTLLQDKPISHEERATARAEFLGACDQIANDAYTLLVVAFWRAGGSDEANWIIPNYADKTLLPDPVPT
jgi:hypothetical protein